MDWRKELADLENTLYYEGYDRKQIMQSVNEFVTIKLDKVESVIKSIEMYLEENKPSCKSCNWSEEDVARDRIIQDIEEIIKSTN